MEAGEREENLRRQEEEAEALAAIYGDDFSSRVGDAGTVWEIRVPLGDPDDDPTDAPRTLHTRDGTPAQVRPHVRQALRRRRLLARFLKFRPFEPSAVFVAPKDRLLVVHSLTLSYYLRA